MAARRTVIVLEITDDQDRPWHEALGLPAPERWNPLDAIREVEKDAFPREYDAYVELVYDRRLA